MIPGITSSQGLQPGSATSVSASAGNGQATVSFTVPVYDGKGVATYQVVSDPQALYANGASSPITVTGLSNGTSYTFTVSTISGYGPSGTSSASSAVTPAAPAPPSFPPSFGPSFPPSFCSPCGGCDSGNLICYQGTLYNYVTCYPEGCPSNGCPQTNSTAVGSC